MKRKYKKIPCPTCISLAICKPRKILKCSLLYDYMLDDHIIPVDSTFYTRIRKIKRVYGKMYRKFHYAVDSKSRFIIYWETIK